jgi:hypothetical protein
MKIRSLLLGLLLIAPGLQASEKGDSHAFWTLLETMLTHKDASTLTLDNPNLVNILIKHPSSSTHLSAYLLSSRDPDTIQSLLEHNADVNVRSLHDDATPLIARCSEVSQCPSWDALKAPLQADTLLKCVRLLLKQPSILVNAIDRNNKTALLRLIEPVNPQRIPDKIGHFVYALLEHNADPYVENEHEKSVFTLWPALSAPEQRSHRVHFMCQIELSPYFSEDLAKIIVGYTPEGFQEEQAKKAARTALTKTS